MSKHKLLFSEDPLEALRIRGYTLNAAPYGFNLGPKTKIQSYKVSVFGSVFMNDLMVRSGLSEAASFRYMFGKKRYEVGDLASCSPLMSEDIIRNGRSYEEADQRVLDLFLSDAISKAGIRMPCLYEVPLVNANDVTETYEEGGETKLRIKGDDDPFYYLVNMFQLQTSEAATPQLPDDWKAMLTKRQYSYYFDVGGQRLAVSNTESAYFGLPPNSKALRMPLLKTQIIPENCNSPAASRRASPPKKTPKAPKTAKKEKKEKKEKKPSEAKQAAPENQVAWQPLLKAFFETPSEANYRKIIDCGSAWKEFYEAKDNVLKLSKYAAKRMRKPYVGAANAVGGSALCEVIGAKWADDKPRLIVLLKWATLTRWEQGKVFFKEEGSKDAEATGKEAAEADKTDAAN